MNKLKLKRLIYRIQHDYLTLNNVVIAAAIFKFANEFGAWGVFPLKSIAKKLRIATLYRQQTPASGNRKIASRLAGIRIEILSKRRVSRIDY